jgi:uncharacterized protein YcbK (DUF882 family)
MQWTRGNGTQLTPNFHAREFECSCGVCKIQIMNDQFLDYLEQLRADYGQPIKIHSGYRCQRRQDDLAKQGYETAKGVSAHTMGNASDVAGDDMAALGESVQRVFANMSIGTAHSFYHIDSRPNGPRRWSYLRS